MVCSLIKGIGLLCPVPAKVWVGEQIFLIEACFPISKFLCTWNQMKIKQKPETVFKEKNYGVKGRQGSCGAVLSRKDVPGFVSGVWFQATPTSLPLVTAVVTAFPDLG